MRAVPLLLLAACAAPAPAPPAPPPPPPDPVIEAANPEWEKIARDLARGRSVVEQQQIYESQRHYELALAYYNKGDFERAKVSAQRAVQASSENLAARKLLSEILSLFGDRQALTPAESEVRQAIIRIEGDQIEITKHLRDGERYFHAKMYSEALREFENAEFKILHLPTEVKSANELLPRTREQIRRCKNAVDLEAKALRN